MKIKRDDTFLIGLCLAFSVGFFFDKEYIGIAIEGFILGIYFGIKYAHDKYVNHAKVEGEKDE